MIHSSLFILIYFLGACIVATVYYIELEKVWIIISSAIFITALIFIRIKQFQHKHESVVHFNDYD